MPTSSKRAKDRPTGKTHCLGTWPSSQQRDRPPSGLFLTMSSSSTRLGSVLLDFPGQSHFPTSRPLVTPCVQSSESEHVFPINKKPRKETCSSCLQPALVTSVIPVSPSMPKSSPTSCGHLCSCLELSFKSVLMSSYFRVNPGSPSAA